MRVTGGHEERCVGFQAPGAALDGPRGREAGKVTGGVSMWVVFIFISGRGRRGDRGIIIIDIGGEYREIAYIGVKENVLIKK